MTRQEAVNLFEWLRNTYPRNYRDADPRQQATQIDNLTKVFTHNLYKDVQAEYERVYATQKNEPHPSEIKRAIRSEKQKAVASEPPEMVLRRKPEYDTIAYAYGERETLRQAKLCVETASIGELKFRLERDQ